MKLIAIFFVAISLTAVSADAGLFRHRCRTCERTHVRHVERHSESKHADAVKADDKKPECKNGRCKLRQK